MICQVANLELVSWREATVGVHDGFENHITDFLGAPERITFGKGHSMPFPAENRENNVVKGGEMHFAPFVHLWGPSWRLRNGHLLIFLDGLDDGLHTGPGHALGTGDGTVGLTCLVSSPNSGPLSVPSRAREFSWHDK
jgi:hypothetical protein